MIWVFCFDLRKSKGLLTQEEKDLENALQACEEAKLTINNL
jgi:hypothetical protein